jgi:VWFA-related protein
MDGPHKRMRVPILLLTALIFDATAVFAPAPIVLAALRLQQGSVPSSPAPASQAPQATSPPATAPASAQSTAAPPVTPATQSEMSTVETSPAFHVKVNLVLVRVIVRDDKGNVVRGLKREDFKLFDGRKQQTISQFAVEAADAKAEAAALPGGTILPGEERPLSHRYLGLYFDDVSSEIGDLQHARVAANHFLETALQPGDRIGVFTSSGQGNQDFTDDKDKLREALNNLLPRPVYLPPSNDCPDIDHYQAYQIVETSDPNALAIAVAELESCLNLTALQAQLQAQSHAVAILNGAQNQAQYTMRGLEGLIRRMEVLPGQRTIVMVSSGFLSLDALTELDQLSDLALRARVVVNTLNIRGLYTLPGFSDVSKDDQGLSPQLAVQLQILRQTSDQLDDGTLSQIAETTGGITFQNNNDLYEGLHRTAGLPEFAYLLGFAPLDAKPDGQFHNIRVEVAGPLKYVVQARKGYFAAKKNQAPEQQAEEEIREAVFSQDDESAVPIDLHTQFYKASATEAKLSVLTHVDIRRMGFVRQGDRNADELLIVSVVFDRNGNYVQGTQKKITLRLRDASRAELEKTGITSKSSFDVPPGTYLVRAVVRDSNGDKISAMNRTVEIPN